MKTTAEIIQANVDATDARNSQARKAIRAIERAYAATNHFEGGDMASHEIMEVLRKAINEEFRR